MAKQTGIGWTTLSIDDFNPTQRAIKNDFTNLSFSTPRAVQDVTGLDKTAIERLLLLADMTWTGNGVFNAASNMSHAVFSTIPLSSSAPRLVTMVVNGATLAPTLVLTDYQITRPATGELTWQVPGSLSSGTPPTWA